MGHEQSELIVNEVLSWINTPYRHQASVKNVGCDCLGLVRGVWRHLYGTEPEPLPVYSPDWAERGQGELLHRAANQYLIATATPKAGSVLLFRMNAASPIKHCGILINKHEFVHAYWGRSVSCSAFGRWWRRRVSAVYNFPPLN